MGEFTNISIKTRFLGLITSLIILLHSESTTGMESIEKVDTLPYKSSYFFTLVYDDNLLENALEANPLLIDQPDEKGDRLLHHAAHLGLTHNEGHIRSILQILFAYNPNINIFNQDDETPLHMAAKRCNNYTTNTFVFPTLLDYAADYATKSNAENKSTLFNPPNKMGITPLHIAAQTLHWSRVQQRFPIRHYLTDKIKPLVDFNVIVPPSNQTPLHWAFLTEMGYDDTIPPGNSILLIKAGVNVDLYFDDPDRSNNSKGMLAELVDEIRGTFYSARYDPILQTLSGVD